MTINLKNFLNPKMKISKIRDFQELKEIKGLSLSSISADLYGNGRDDITLFYFEKGAKFSAIYTKSKITSASINWNLRIKRQFVKALFINTQNANTMTGQRGAEGLKEIARVLAKSLTLKGAQSPDGIRDVVKPTDLLFASTGVIGEVFPTTKIKNRINYLVQKLKKEQNKYVWLKSASAIMTTDTKPKLAYEECKIGNKTIKISGIAKGSGMIAPNMATMLAFIFTDADIPSVFLRAILKKVVATTFNSITVDGDTSTNDSVILFSTGAVNNPKIYNVLDPKLKEFENALHEVMLNLAKQIVADGEGAKKFITVNVVNARSVLMAKNIAFAIANSPLVKTAIGGEDPNWGRIVMAIGKTEENITLNKLKIKIGSFLIVENGQQAEEYNEKDLKEYMKWDAIDINVDLGLGASYFTVYTCDFTKEYIEINSDYRN